MAIETYNTVQIKPAPDRYLGAMDYITAPLFSDEPIEPFNSGVLDCSYEDCREYSWGSECYLNEVFADSNSSSEIKNDKTSFLFFYPFTTTAEFTNSSLACFYLEKRVNNVWTTMSLLTGTTYGEYYDFQSLSIDGYKGYVIYWKNVMAQHGEGIYRYKVQSTIYGTSSCVVSPAYWLQQFTCAKANKSTKFEATITGKIGKKSTVYNSQVTDLATSSDLIDLTGIEWYMSLRVPGFFGKETTEYETTNIEYENGEINTVRDEAIQKYEWTSGRLPKYIHDNLKVYFFMADRLKVSDYNFNNPDYFINQKEIVKDGGYEPEYNINSRLSRVKVSFKDRYQNLIKRFC